MKTQMLSKLLLINREITVEGNWYKPVDYLSTFNSVVSINYTNQTSSAGDWQGYFIQKIWNRYYLIPFSQEASWPKYGFFLYTGNVVAKSEKMFTQDDINQIIEGY